MLPKKLFIKAKAIVLKLCERLKGETNNKSGLSAVPIEIGRGIEEQLRRLAREEHERITDKDVDEFLKYMVTQKIIAVHPWGGYMVPQTAEIPPLENAEKMVKEAMGKLLSS